MTFLEPPSVLCTRVTRRNEHARAAAPVKCDELELVSPAWPWSFTPLTSLEYSFSSLYEQIHSYSGNLT
jgi:hypothetical protein